MANMIRQVRAGDKRKNRRQSRENVSSLKAQLESASLFIYASFFEASNSE